MNGSINERILNVINSNIQNVDLKKEDSDKDLMIIGMDSINFIRIVVALEEEFNLEIPDSYLLMSEMNTLNKITDVLTLAEVKNIENELQ